MYDKIIKIKISINIYIQYIIDEDIHFSQNWPLFFRQKCLMLYFFSRSPKDKVTIFFQVFINKTLKNIVFKSSI